MKIVRPVAIALCVVLTLVPGRDRSRPESATARPTAAAAIIHLVFMETPRLGSRLADILCSWVVLGTADITRYRSWNTMARS